MNNQEEIDVNFNFTDDTPQFWTAFWMGRVAVDPDAESETLKRYHKVLWSQQLPKSKLFPKGASMNLVEGKKWYDYLTCNVEGKEFRFSSDTIFNGFRYINNRVLIEQVMKAKGTKYQKFVENYMKKAYTIGGSIIFPTMEGSINQVRGTNPFICDRFDLTLECIRKYYKGEKDFPLYEVFSKEENQDFFALFKDFQGYVKFFYLQDMVSKDPVSKEYIVNFWLGNGDLYEKYPFPKSVDEYYKWIDNQLEFIKKRNQRIKREMLKRNKL